MVAALTLTLVAFSLAPPARAGSRSALPGDLLFVSPEFGDLEGFFVDAGAPLHDLPAAPRAVLSNDDRLSSRRRTGPFDAAALPLNLSLETWQGTWCVKGAWSIRAAGRAERPGDLGLVFRDLQISPAVIADGMRLGPGIGASTRF